jgi:membrane protease YdiL (CAAX protease family)
LPANPIHSESDSIIKKSKAKIFLWAILWAIFPPVLIFVLLASIVKPAIKGREPNGVNYILWILGLILLATIFYLPFGSISTISQALRNPSIARMMLLADAIGTMVSIFLIGLTFRKKKIPNPYVPITKFEVDKTIIVLWFLSLLPLLSLFSPKSVFLNLNEMTHPLLAAFISSYKNASYFSFLVGFLSIGIFGPILEEIIFRGLLLERSHEIERSKGMRYFLDFVVCLFFALLHLPVSFIAPLILAAAFIYVRRRSGSLLPSIFMHVSWNSSILMAMIVVNQNI